MTELIVCPVRYRVFPAAILIVVLSFAPTSTAFTYCVESTFRFSPLEENLRKSSCEELDVAGTVESAHVAELLQFPLVLTIDSPKSADDAIEEKINKYLAVFIYSVFNDLIFSKKRVDNFKIKINLR